MRIRKICLYSPIAPQAYLAPCRPAAAGRAAAAAAAAGISGGSEWRCRAAAICVCVCARARARIFRARIRTRHASVTSHGPVRLQVSKRQGVSQQPCSPKPCRDLISDLQPAARSRCFDAVHLAAQVLPAAVGRWRQASTLSSLARRRTWRPAALRLLATHRARTDCPLGLPSYQTASRATRIVFKSGLRGIRVAMSRRAWR